MILSKSHLRPKSIKPPRPLLFTITLTSLIDAFSILVIFLLMQSPTGEADFMLKNTEKLPTVNDFAPVDQGVSVKVSEGKYFIEETEVPEIRLVAKLLELRKNQDSIIVQADRQIDFLKISPLIQASAQTGFEKIKFAVLPRRKQTP